VEAASSREVIPIRRVTRARAGSGSAGQARRGLSSGIELRSHPHHEEVLPLGTLGTLG